MIALDDGGTTEEPDSLILDRPHKHGTVEESVPFFAASLWQQDAPMTRS
jgi:hypothetical protein